MKILVLAQDYLKDKNYAMLYVHTRNTQYLKNNIEVDVINFKENSYYEVDSINVYGVDYFQKNKNLSDYDLVVSHAPNIKNHFRFIFKNLKSIKNLVLFIHGHEVLLKDKYYPSPYKFQKNRFISKFIHFFYDRLKVKLFKIFINLLIRKGINLNLVFVSEWMKEEFFKCTKASEFRLKDKCHIIHNPVNTSFIDRKYEPSSEFDADFITIRPFDGPKYSIDLLCRIAKSNPSLTFSLYGKGEYFKFNSCPSNIKIYEKFLLHHEIPDLLNKHRAALMLTKLDAQGVMVCEMACYGIPVITSDIPLKRELLGSAENVSFFKNDLSVQLTSLKIQTGNNQQIKERFSDDSTLQKEINLMKQVINPLT